MPPDGAVGACAQGMTAPMSSRMRYDFAKPTKAPQGRGMYRTASLLRPVVQEFKGIFEARDFLYEAVAVFHENGAVERPCAHQVLLNPKSLNVEKAAMRQGAIHLRVICLPRQRLSRTLAFRF
jgi:hypothetical protein